MGVKFPEKKRCTYPLAELVNTSHADSVGLGRTVQSERIIEANVTPGGHDRILDGKEDGGSEKQRWLTDTLVGRNITRSWCVSTALARRYPGGEKHN